MSTSTSNLYQLIWQTRRLFQRLRVSGDALLEGTGINASQRAVLEFLDGGVALTVPGIAEERSVSRQHVQKVVNDLLELGLVEMVKNPAHKRSQLVQATASGKKLFKSVRKKESAFIADMEKSFSPQDLARACRVLKLVDESLALRSSK
jgi:DNA-binding MarR family transcriptional regulator